MPPRIEGGPPQPPPTTTTSGTAGTSATGGSAQPAKHDPKNPTNLSMRDSFERAPPPNPLFPTDTMKKIAQEPPLKQMNGQLRTLAHATTKQEAAEAFRNVLGFLKNLPVDQRTQVLNDPGVKQQLAAMVGDPKSAAGKALSGIAEGPLGDLVKSVQQGKIGDIAAVIGSVVEIGKAVTPDVGKAGMSRDVNVRGVTIDVDKAREVLKKYGLL